MTMAQLHLYQEKYILFADNTPKGRRALTGVPSGREGDGHHSQGLKP